MKRYAYVTFVMRNDSFIPGALVFAYGLRKQNTEADLICIVTENVSDHAKQALNILFDRVIVIDEIYVPHKDRHERQDRPFLFTRFHAFRLGKDGDLDGDYDKILLCDADLLPIRHYDSLFELQAPAGVLNEKKAYCMESENGKYVIPDSVFEDSTWIWHRVYKDIPFGSPIPKAITDRVKTDQQNMGVNAALYLFEPSLEFFEDIIDDLEKETTKEEIGRYPWPEMQYITAKLSGEWHNMDLKFSSFNGYPTLEVLNGIHYAGLKPWQLKHRSIMHFAKNDDYKLWYAVFMQMVNEYPDLLEYRKLSKLSRAIETMTHNDNYRFHKQYLPNLKHLFES